MDSFKSASMQTNMNASSLDYAQPNLKPVVDPAISKMATNKIEAAPQIEDVTFEVKGAEEMPAAYENHFEGSQTRKEGESLVRNSVMSTYGIVQNFMYNYFKKIKGQKAVS